MTQDTTVPSPLLSYPHRGRKLSASNHSSFHPIQGMDRQPRAQSPTPTEDVDPAWVGSSPLGTSGQLGEGGVCTPQALGMAHSRQTSQPAQLCLIPALEREDLEAAFTWPHWQMDR